MQSLILAASESWLTHERRYWIAGVLLSAAVGFGVGNGHTTDEAIAHVSDQYGQKAAKVVVLQKELKAAKGATAPAKAEHPTAK